MAFEMNDRLEDLIGRYARDINTLEQLPSMDQNQATEMSVFSDQEEINVAGTPNQIRPYVLAFMSQFPEFFEDIRLSKGTWSEFLNSYYNPLNQETKDRVLIDSLKYINEKQRKELTKHPYTKLILKIANIQSLLEKARGENLSEEELIALVRNHFTEIVKERKVRKDNVKVNPYVAKAIETYGRNPNAMHEIMAMKQRIYGLQKPRTDPVDASKFLGFDEKDAEDNYSIGNYSKATKVYMAYAAQEAQRQEQPQEE